MSKFSQRKSVVKQPVKTTGARARTYEGHLGYERDAKSELFLLSVVNMVGEDTFYESAKDRDSRFVNLVRVVAEEDPEWIARFIPFLRKEMFMRSASVVMAAEFVRALADVGEEVLIDPSKFKFFTNEIERLKGTIETENAKSEPDEFRIVNAQSEVERLESYLENKKSIGRVAVNMALSRADEPGEILAYWLSTYGRPLPNSLRRGVADAAQRLYTAYNAVKYDGVSQAWRPGDVINLVHPKPKNVEQENVFKWLLDRRYGNVSIDGDYFNVNMIESFEELWAIPAADRFSLLKDGKVTAKDFKAAGMTWEMASTWAGQLTAEVWETVIPSMGYMALLRNLRNFDKVGVSEDTKDYVNKKLSDPNEVARSMQFPFRFLSAWKAAQSMTWARSLERALDHSTKNIPELPGRTLVLCDTSGSMQAPISAKSSVMRYEVAAVIAASIAKKGNDVSLVSYATDWCHVPMAPGDSVLRVAEKMGHEIGKVGHGTNTFHALTSEYKGHNRVVIVTDEQSHPGPGVAHIKAPIYTYNVGGYAAGHLPAEGNRYTFGGFSDAAFKLMHLLEKGRSGSWNDLF